MALNLILFDLDDTLIDFRGSERWALRHTLEARNVQEPFESYHPVYHSINRRLWNQYECGELSKDALRVDRFRLLCEHFDWKLNFQELADEYLETVNTHVELLPHAPTVCEALSEHYDLGIVTNGFAKVQKERFAKSGLSPFFKFVVISELQGYPKPDQRIFIDAINKLPGKDLANSLMVGDRIETDVLGAKKAGIKSCWFNREQNQNLSPVIPDMEIYCLSDLLTKLL